MAINDIFNSVIFGGVNSLDYGIYISGPAVFDAPTRDVEFVSVPGRNGAIEVDKGHWNNIEVTYHAGVFGDNQSDFASKINAFRNAIVSQIGYQRLTDTYNPEEYRLGIYANGLSVSAVNMNKAGEFDLVFNCKPQRYLLSGENEITVTSGQTINNPTLYDASPLIQVVEGFGAIKINEVNIVIDYIKYGRITAATMQNFRVLPTDQQSTSFKANLINNNDYLIIDSLEFGFVFNDFILNASTSNLKNLSLAGSSSNSLYGYMGEPLAVRYESSGQTIEFSFDASYTIGGETKNSHFSFQLQITGETIYFVFSSDADNVVRNSFRGATQEKTFEILANSTKLVTSGVYIDTEIGDVYKIEDGEYIDLNRYVALGSDLPKLSPGDNEITFDDTITSLKIKPRWWEL